MTTADLPNQDDGSAIFDFAMTFDGYQHFGSFEGSTAAAASGDRSSLDLIRNELFFSARASRHRGDDEFVATYRDLLPLLRSYVDDASEGAPSETS